MPGIDALLIGTSDLSIELGIPGKFEDERIVSAYRNVVDACRANGKFAGIGGIYEDALLRRYIGMGVRLVLGGADLGFMQMAATARDDAARLLMRRTSPQCPEPKVRNIASIGFPTKVGTHFAPWVPAFAGKARNR